jgi:hypothetical protein
MSALSIQVPFPVFQDRNGQPLDNGYVWIGVPNLPPQTNPVNVYFDEALTILAPQPLRTINGYISRAGSPAQVYIDGVNFSILVQDSKGSMVYNFPEGTGISSDACGVTYNPPFSGAVPYPVCEKLEQVVSVNDFGAVGDGVTDDAAAIQAAEDYASANSLGVYFPSGTYLCSSVIYRKGNTDWRGDGMYLSVLKHSGGADTHHLVYVADLDTSYDHIGFYNMGFDGNRSGSTDPNVSRIVVYLDRNSAGGVDSPSKDVRFIGCRLFNFSYGNMGLHIKGYTGVQVKDSVFEDGGSGLYHPIYLRRCVDVSVIGNNSTGRDGNSCIKVQSSPQTVIANNICEGGGRGVFVQDAVSNTVVGNTIYSSTLFGIDSTIELAGNSSDVTITGNTVFGCTGGIRTSNIAIFNLSGNNISGFSTDGINCRAARDGVINGNTLITADSSGVEVKFIDLDAGPNANRVNISGNWLRNSRPSGTTYGIWTNETTVSGIFLSVNAFSGTGWTEKHFGIEPVLYTDPATGIAVGYDTRSFSNSLSEIHGLAAVAGFPGYGAVNWRNENWAPAVNLGKSRSGTVGTNGSSVQSGDELGRLQFNGDHNGSFLAGARVRALVDGTPTPGSSFLPTSLVFETRSASGSAPVIHMTINAAGNIIPVLPTSAAGLPSGALWNSAGTVSVAP